MITYSIILIQIQVFSIIESMPSFADFMASFISFLFPKQRINSLLTDPHVLSATWFEIIKGEQCYLFIANIFFFSGFFRVLKLKGGIKNSA